MSRPVPDFVAGGGAAVFLHAKVQQKQINEHYGFVFIPFWGEALSFSHVGCYFLGPRLCSAASVSG